MGSTDCPQHYHLNTASTYQFNRKRSVCIFDNTENTGFLNTPNIDKAYCQAHTALKHKINMVFFIPNEIQVVTITLEGTIMVNRPVPNFTAMRAVKCEFSLSLLNTRNNMDVEFSVNFSATEGYMILCGPCSLGNCSYPR